MIPVPTIRTIWLVAMTMIAAVLWGWKGALFLDAGIFLCCSLDYILCFRDEEIQATRIQQGRLSQKVSQDIEIELRNTGARIKKVRVRDYSPVEWDAAPVLEGMVQARASLRLTYTVLPQERGKYTFGDITLRVEGPMGLVFRPVIIPASEVVKVYPSLQALQYSDVSTYRRRASHWGQRPVKWRGAGREFESLREYVDGDDPRKIHWKATARFDRPIVQEFCPEKNQIVIVLLDAGRLMCAESNGKTKLDHALDAAIQLTNTALSGGDQAGILAFSDHVISFLPPKRTPEQLQLILEETLALNPVLKESQYEQALLWVKTRVKRRSLVVIFTDLLDDVASENLLSAVTLLRPRHLPLCITIRESEWDDLLSHPPSGVQDVYERAVLLETLRHRRKGLKSLVQKGALAMDLTPEMLSAGTLERYMEVKRRGLL